MLEQDGSKEVRASLKRSAGKSHNRKAESFRSAVPMLAFYINRAGKNVPETRKHVLETAKEELRKAYRKPDQD